jgi:hypothetical protein
MLQRLGFLPALAVGALLLAAPPASAQRRPLFFDDFEGYHLGSLDKNDRFGGPNTAPNGSGNPWFGPEFSGPNLQVVGTEGGVQPVSGSQMVRGTRASDVDQDWYNLAYRLNGGLPFAGEVILAWWFYDPLGPGGTDYQDYVALGFYDTAPPDTDAPAGYNLNAGARQIQRLSLGATTNTGSDPNVYQARVVGARDGYNANGWFNTPVPRAVGWHQAAIHVGLTKRDSTNEITFYIDDGVNPVLRHNSVTDYGFNVIEINADYGAATAYFDDIGFYRGQKRDVARLFGQ